MRPASKNWQLLEAEFGSDVAKAFRDGLVAFWRIYNPVLASEREEAKTPWEVHWGLYGLAIEAADEPGWVGRLTSEEALLASRYSTCELKRIFLSGSKTWLYAMRLHFFRSSGRKHSGTWAGRTIPIPGLNCLRKSPKPLMKSWACALRRLLSFLKTVRRGKRQGPR